ncbi:hypothetical protein V6N11_031819 [Hibiscus sabdariffa]|uniref:Uncharacterized protein n=1 Tax=Hibiscus sabdariffa TaxID=183260 RepID=A0ABR2SZ31_9ROSI
MGESEPCSKKLKVMGGRDWDGVLRDTLLFCAWKPTDTEGDFKVDWHTLNLETREISPALITMPPEVGEFFSAVVYRNHVYVLGGSCSMDSHLITGQDHVFCFDSDHPDHGWKQAPSMSVPRFNPTVVAAEAQGKIYAFTGSQQFGDVFDVGRSCWKLLSPPPDVDLDNLYLSGLLHYDSPRSRILCHFQTYDFRGSFLSTPTTLIVNHGNAFVKTLVHGLVDRYWWMACSTLSCVLMETGMAIFITQKSASASACTIILKKFMQLDCLNLILSSPFNSKRRPIVCLLSLNEGLGHSILMRLVETSVSKLYSSFKVI